MKKKLLFIDRDGTLIKEPPVTFQVDTLEQLEFVPGVIRNLYRIYSELDYELVLVTNQDGLGTDAYPEDRFRLVQDKMMQALRHEGIHFAAVHIDRSFAHEHKPTRKPGTGMLTAYINGDYDLSASWVIGDRLTDVQLAERLGARAVFLKNYDDPAGWEDRISILADTWDDIYRALSLPARTATYHRKTAETDIHVSLNLDGNGQYRIETGIGFFNHMLEQLSRHSGMDITLTAAGDLHVDEHHTVEDTAIALGTAIRGALGDKAGIERYGFCLPMDDCLAQVAVDFGGRSWIEWDAVFTRERIGDMPTELFFHFFKSFSDAVGCNLNIKAAGVNEHHKIEAIFKALARAVKAAIRRAPGMRQLPTTKGIL